MNALRHWWGKGYLSAKTASVYILLLSALFYLLGGYRSQPAYNRMENELNKSRQEMRLFADEIARRNGQLNNLRARDSLNKKTIDLLSGKIEYLENENILWQEKIAFYQHVLESKTATGSEVIIHALEANPDFARQEWKISAILARPGKRKKFSGSYYFEIVHTLGGGGHLLVRAPQEGTKTFEMNLYHEIEEAIKLPTDNTIEDLRVVILDKKGAHIAALETGSLNNGGDNGRANNAADNGDLNNSIDNSATDSNDNDGSEKPASDDS